MTEAFGQLGYTDSVTGTWTPYDEDESSNEGRYPRETTIAELELINTPVLERHDYQWVQLGSLDQATRGQLVMFDLGLSHFVGRVIDHKSNGIFLETTVRIPNLGDINVGGDAPEENPRVVFVGEPLA